jgi:hypothetical protein
MFNYEYNISTSRSHLGLDRLLIITEKPPNLPVRDSTVDTVTRIRTRGRRIVSGGEIILQGCGEVSRSGYSTRRYYAPQFGKETPTRSDGVRDL